MVEISILIASSLLNGLLGFIVYSKNPQSATNKLFALLCMSFISWSVVNYFSLHPIFVSQLTWIRFVLLFAAFLCLCANMTLVTFPHQELQSSSRSRTLVLLSTAFVMALTLTPLVFKGLVIKNGQPSPVPNFGVALFVTLVVTLLGQGVLNLFLRYRKSGGIQKAQLGWVIFGLSGSFLLILSTNLFLVILFHNSKLVSLGSAYTLVFSGTLYYAIVQTRLFDIRATTARLVAYVVSLGVVGLAYGLLIVALSSLFPINTNIHDVIDVIFVMLIAVLYPVTKQSIARLTNRIFYQDLYNPQQLFDALNRVLVANAELNTLITRALEVINESLKTEFGAVVFTIPAMQGRIIGTLARGFDPKDLATIQSKQSVTEMPGVVMIADWLADSDRVLTRTLRKYDIALLARLGDRVDSQKNMLGYLFLGSKKSGRSYDSQDVQVVEAIANELVIAIQNALHFEEIQRFNVTLQKEVDDATRKLRRTNRMLIELDETKDDFISMASHQLRTPLTSVKGYLSMVIEGDAGKLTPTESKMLKQAFTSSQRMVYLITDLLNISRLKTGKFVIESIPTNLNDIIQSEIAQLVETAKMKDVTLTYQKPATFPTLMFDETKIRQVIMNFIDNAIYYTPAGGHIKVELVDKPSTVELHVIDDGIGVPKSEQHHLFTKFYRAGNARKARPDGTGLGLFMAKKVIIAQGGSIIFSSKQGEGSTFGFTFSKSRLKVPASITDNPAKPVADIKQSTTASTPAAA